MSSKDLSEWQKPDFCPVPVLKNLRREPGQNVRRSETGLLPLFTTCPATTLPLLSSPHAHPSCPWSCQGADSKRESHFLSPGSACLTLPFIQTVFNLEMVSHLCCCKLPMRKKVPPPQRFGNAKCYLEGTTLWCPHALDTGLPSWQRWSGSSPLVSTGLCVPPPLSGSLRNPSLLSLSKGPSGRQGQRLWWFGAACFTSGICLGLEDRGQQDIPRGCQLCDLLTPRACPSSRLILFTHLLWNLKPPYRLAAVTNSQE